MVNKHGCTHPFNDAVARVVCTRVAASVLWHFRRHADWAMEDLVSEGVLYAIRIHEKYRSRQGKYDTWLFGCVRRHLIDLGRSVTADQRRAGRAARSEVTGDVELWGVQVGLTRVEIGRRIRRERMARGLTQVQLAKSLQMNRASIYRVEAGVQVLTFAQWAYLRRRFNYATWAELIQAMREDGGELCP